MDTSSGAVHYCRVHRRPSFCFLVLLLLGCFPMQDLDGYSRGAGAGASGGSGGGDGSGGAPASLINPGPTCGDGVVTATLGELCDAAGQGVDCRADCVLAECPAGCACQARAGRTFVLCAEALSWEAAGSRCAEAGERLATVFDARDNELLAWMAASLPVESFWLGGSDAVTEGDWRWSDAAPFWSGGASGVAAAGSFVRWRASQPDDYQASQDCLLVNDNGRWDDDACGAPRAFACERPQGVLERCGDGRLDSEEPCDTTAPAAECDADCTRPSCGDGVLNAAAGEGCDDNNSRETDACDARCQPTGLVAHWPLTEKVGTTAWDTIAGYNGTVPEGSFDGGPGLALDGVSRALSVPGLGPRVQGEITLAAWVRLVEFPSGPIGNVIEHAVGATETWLRFVGDTLMVGAWIEGTGEQAQTNVSAIVLLGQWAHVAGRFDGAQWELFVDGALVASSPGTLGALPVNGGWSVGGRSSERFLNARVLDARVYQRALADSQIAALAGLLPAE